MISFVCVSRRVLVRPRYGIGGMAMSLELGCDCLGDITYLDHAQVTIRSDRQCS